MHIEPALIDYFRKGITTADKSDEVDFATINKKAVLLGWIIHPECCNKSVDAWLNTLTANYNATFYKEWEDVTSKDRFELYLDQIRHYASTYGAGEYSVGNGYVPNEGSVKISFKNMKVLEPLDEDGFAKRIWNVLKTGIALKESTMKALCGFLVDYTNQVPTSAGDEYKEVVAKALLEVKNKEAQCYLAKMFGVLPNEEFSMLRCIIYDYTGSTMLIKSKTTISTIKSKAEESSLIFKSPLLTLTEKQMVLLSRIFLRFKPIFLAMKNGQTSHIINKLRRLAEKNHRPLKIGFWQNIITTKRSMKEIHDQLGFFDNFHKVRLMMLIREKLESPTTSGVYIIRNGRMWVRQGYAPKYDLNWMNSLYFMIESSLVESLKAKACKVKFPTGYDIAIPSSEKTFIGNYPYGTSFGFTENNVVGIYWRGEWGTNDFDLSYTDLFGTKIGWNSYFFNNINANSSTVIYSGDMTRADPEATELLYMKTSAPDGLIKINRYSGKRESKFRFFFANESLSPYEMRNHMVDPNNIKFDTMLVSEDDKEQTIGMVISNRFYLMDVKSGKRKTSRSGKWTMELIENMKRKVVGFIPLKGILLRAGFTIVEDGETPDIDFTNLEKDTLIKLLAQ